MDAKKYIVLFIIFIIVMPCKIIFGQDVEGDTAVQSELDIKYDSILAKAASSLTASAYQQSIDYYKQASALKPSETYAYKMINYVQDLAVKQKRSDDLKRKAQIKDDLMRANQAIVNRNWVSARAAFNKVLTLQPEKGDEEYAKSKIAAIDLELARIAARIPVKVEPPVVVLPKNRREARAQRKLAERNVSLASASNKAIAPKPIQSKADVTLLASAAAKKNAVITPGTSTSAASAKKIDYQLLKRFNEDFKDASNINWTLNSKFSKADFLQDDEKVEAFYDLDGTLIGTTRYISIDELPKETKKIFATKYPQYHITEVMRYEGGDVLDEVNYYITTEDHKEKVVFKLSGKDVSVFYRELAGKNEASAISLARPIPGKPTDTALPEKKVASAVDLPKTKEIQQKPIQTEAPTKTVASASSSIKDTNRAVQQKPIQTALPTSTTALPPANRVPQKPAETPLAKNETISPAPAETKPASSTAKNRIVAVPPSRETQQKPLTTPQTTNAAATFPSTREIQQKTFPSPSLPEDTISAPSTVEIPQKTIDGHPLKLSDSSDYVKLICQDISFIGSNAYIKVLIQNYSPTTQFTTDTLHVSIKKNDGSIKKLDQRFISNFPVIMPMKESVLVSFADATMNIDPDDIFIVEMQDKIRKTKLTVQVPWSVYNQKKSL